MEINFSASLLIFLLSAAVVIVSGILLAKSGDAISEHSGLGRVWVGSLLVAGATSLPELVTVVSAVLLDSPSLALGTIFGANMINMAKFSILVLIFGGSNIFKNLLKLQVWVATFAFSLTFVGVLMIVFSNHIKIFGVSPFGILLIILYFLTSKFLYQNSFSDSSEGNIKEHDSQNTSIKKHWILFFISAAMIFIAAPLLTYSSEKISEFSNISQSFIGVLGLGFVASLPEFTAAAAGFKIGAPDLGVSALFGSNSFNIAALGVADIFYTNGSLFSSSDTSHLLAGIFATILIGLCLVQLYQKREMNIYSFKTPSPLIVILIYILGIFVVFNSG